MRDKLREFIHNNFADEVIGEEEFRDQLAFYIKPDALLTIVKAIQQNDELDARFLSDITSVDWLDTDKEERGRFEVVYNFFSLKHKFRYFLKVCLPAENPEVASLTPLYDGANWLEREVWDMMGIKFTGHPDLTKILTPDELEGHPLRRDFPLTWEQPVFSWNKDDPPEVIK